MPRPRPHEDTVTPAFVPGGQRTRYLVARREDVWLIDYGDEAFGPYNTDREALLFAIDAAQKLGEQGEPTVVLLVDELGVARPIWTYGKDPYPPRL